VLEEGHEGCCDTHHLVRRDVLELNLLRERHAEVSVQASRNEAVLELAVRVDRGRSLSDVAAFFLKRAEPLDLVGDPTILHVAVGRLDVTVLVHASEGRERRDEADVRTFRRLNRADAAVVRGVNVSHLEARALTGKTTRTE